MSNEIVSFAYININKVHVLEHKWTRDNWIKQEDGSYMSDYFHFKLNEDESLFTFVSIRDEVKYDINIHGLYEMDKNKDWIRVK